MKNHTFLFAFILFSTFLLFRPGATGQTECQELQSEDDIKALIKLGSTVEPVVVVNGEEIDKVDKAAKKIHDNYLELCNLFRAGDYDGMADILGKKASLKTADGEFIRGQGNIEKYWRKMKEEENYERVEFELVWAVIVHEERKPIFARDTDNMIHENFKYHLIRQSEGKILQNQDGDGERSGRHTHGCEWVGN